MNLEGLTPSEVREAAEEFNAKKDPERDLEGLTDETTDATFEQTNDEPEKLSSAGMRAMQGKVETPETETADEQQPTQFEEDIATDDQRISETSPEQSKRASE